MVRGDEHKEALPFLPETGRDVVTDELQALHSGGMLCRHNGLEEEDPVVRADDSIKRREAL